MVGMKAAPLAFFLCTTMSPAANYTAERIVVEGIPVIRLADAARATEVMIAPSMGNNAYRMTVKGTDVLWSPYATLSEWKAKPVQQGNPFLAPWANRIDGDGYFANGKQYFLNAGLGNFRKDGNGLPIHGLLVYAADWEVISLRATGEEAAVSSRLEFWHRPEWMAQFPFAHAIVMSYRLRDGVLEVETLIENLSREPMPVSVGYHTYYQLPGSPRDNWKVHLPAREHVVLSKVLVPTGEKKPVELPDPVPLAGSQLDDVFTGLVRDGRGRAVFWVEGDGRRITVEFGPKYPVAVVYAPPGRNFICFEPMTGVTNAFNLAHRGVFPDLQTIPSGAEWRESFWIAPGGR